MQPQWTCYNVSVTQAVSGSSVYPPPSYDVLHRSDQKVAEQTLQTLALLSKLDWASSIKP